MEGWRVLVPVIYQLMVTDRTIRSHLMGLLPRAIMWSGDLMSKFHGGADTLQGKLHQKRSRRRNAPRLTLGRWSSCVRLDLTAGPLAIARFAILFKWCLN